MKSLNPRPMILSFLAGIALVSSIGLTLTVIAAPQESPRMLRTGTTLNGSLEQHGKQVFSIGLDKDQFMYGEVNQITVDVVITVKDPEGEQVGRFDNPARGPEPFQINTETSGLFIIEVTPFEEGSGDFAIQVTTVEPVATTPETRVDQIMAKYRNPDGPGGVVTVTNHGKIIFTKGYGLANIEYGAPNTPTTPFHLASVSKQFTAFAIMLLEQQGKLSLTDDIRKYIPELSDFGETITIRHLLNHTSGLRDQWNLWSISGGRMDDVIRTEDLMTLMVNQRELNFKPGDEFLYCNSGFMLLAQIVSRVSGMPFREFMKKNVFDPLDMKNSQIYDDHQRIVPGRAYSYANGQEGRVKAVLSYANSGATSQFSSAEDLAKWVDNWRTMNVGGKELIGKMQQRGVLNNGDTITYALGVGISSFEGQRMISHGGGDAGFRTYVAYFPDIEVGVVTLGNDGSFNSGGVAFDAVKAFFPDAFTPAEEQSSQQSAEVEEEKPEPWKPTPEELKAFEGRYYSQEIETFYTIAYKDTALIGYQRRLGDIVLTPQTEEDHFQGNQFALRNVRFDTKTGEMFVSNGRVRDLRFKRVED